MEDGTTFQDLSGFEFFVIILSNSLKKLRLPGKFAKVLDGREPQEVKLREAGRQQRLWDVEVVFDADGHMYLGDGWEKFAHAHDLRLGHFLVLSYDGHTVLTLKVFDGSMCRRDYQHDDDASSGSSRDSDSNNSSMVGMDINDGPTSAFRVMPRKGNLVKKQQQGAELTRFDSNGKEKALHCAAMRNASGVQKPSTFDVDDSSSSCVRTTKSSAEEGSDSDGSQKESFYCHKKSAKMPAISYSSEELSEDSLSVDNFVETANLRTLSNNYVISSQCYLTKAQKVKIDALIEKIQPKITVLVVQMKKTNVKRHGNLIIQKDYALEHFPCENTTVILRLPGKNKDWKCTFHISPSNVSDAGRRNLFLPYFGCDNNIREGDICLFQPMTNVKQKRFIVTVHIIHKVSVDHSPGGRTDIDSNHRRTSATMGGLIDSLGASERLFMLSNRVRLTRAQEMKLVQKVGHIKFKSPFFVAIMSKSTVCQRANQNAPMLRFGLQYTARYLIGKFAAGHHRVKRSAIELVLQREGKSISWPTKLRHCWGGSRVLKGWPSFARDNHLREGDICLFKLMKNEEPLTMMVYIVRR